MVVNYENYGSFECYVVGSLVKI